MYQQGASDPDQRRLFERQLGPRFQEVRQQTASICQPLSLEDHVVQPRKEVSPPKWHLGHTTWFFEEMILKRFVPGYRRYDDSFPTLFNSYYKGAGRHWLQSERGVLSRPTVKQVLSYRRAIDEQVEALLETPAIDETLHSILEIGLHHEQQHQELLLMDIKAILATNPQKPSYDETPLPRAQPQTGGGWQAFDEGLYESGSREQGFSFDNERPRHHVYLQPFAIGELAVTNGAYRDFIEDGGYRDPYLWFSLGWDWLEQTQITAPLYWERRDGDWLEYTLHGLVELDPHAPVSHLSYFEASAFASWRGCRLPTEHEYEAFLAGSSQASSPSGWLHPTDSLPRQGQLWNWTSSHYSPYPGFRDFSGLLKEYNGKFMCNQFVLRGGCVATPQGHHRPTYRNFFEPQQRWMFSGLRLAKDVS